MKVSQLSTTPVLPCAFDDFVAVVGLAKERFESLPYPEHEIAFSCSTLGIWPATSHGYVSPENRTYVNGQSWLLDTVAALMRAKRRRGGRFVITLNGAHRACDGEAICRLEVGA